MALGRIRNRHLALHRPPSVMCLFPRSPLTASQLPCGLVALQPEATHLLDPKYDASDSNQPRDLDSSELCLTFWGSLIRF